MTARGTAQVIPDSHPRAQSLRIRHTLVRGFDDGLVAAEGLLAHGRGEAFDYLLGEQTGDAARRACSAAAAALHAAKSPVISVNGNTAALCARQMVRLAKQTGAVLEVNLFYDSDSRRASIGRLLGACGAADIRGLDRNMMRPLRGTDSARRMADVEGIMAADVVVVALEDGDRTGALKQAGKKVIAIDLNPLSRTAQAADISIIDNITRAADVLLDECRRFGNAVQGRDKKYVTPAFDNKINLEHAILQIKSNLARHASDGRAGGLS